MSIKSQSSSRSSLSARVGPVTLSNSFLVIKVDPSISEQQLLGDFQKQATGILKVTRFYNQDGQALGQVRVDCQSANVVRNILEKNFILVHGKRHPVRAYPSVTCHRCHQQGHQSSQCPEKAITEERFEQLLRKHQQNLQEMIANFENKWNGRLATLSQPKNVSNDPLTSLCSDLSRLCELLQLQTSQMQRPLALLNNRGSELAS